MENEIQQLKNEVQVLRDAVSNINSFIDSLSKNLPIQVRDELIKQGFLRFQNDLRFFIDNGISLNTFSSILVRAGTETFDIDVRRTGESLEITAPQTIKPKEIYEFYVDLVNGNLVFFSGVGLINGDYVRVKTNGILPSGLDSTDLYQAINVSGNTFQLSIDGVTPVTVTNMGTGSNFAVKAY